MDSWHVSVKTRILPKSGYRRLERKQQSGAATAWHVAFANKKSMSSQLNAGRQRPEVKNETSLALITPLPMRSGIPLGPLNPCAEDGKFSGDTFIRDVESLQI
jgi:hypothetical protein